MTPLIPVIAAVLDRVIPDPQVASEAKLKALELAQKGELAGLEMIKAEAQGESWLQRNWRPILMLVFGGLIVARWCGFVAPNLSEAEYLKLWSIVEFGLGGYVVGRSVEKIAPSVAEAMKR